MTRFNTNSKNTQREDMLSGGSGFKISPELQLYTIVCASVLTPTFYTPNTNDQLNKIKTLIRQSDPVFVAQLAVYAREQMYLRTIPMVLTVELAKCHKGDDLIKRLSTRVIKRVDEITEMLSFYAKANNLQPKFVKTKGGHVVEKKLYKLSNQLRKGIANSFLNFDEYQFAKYNRDTEIKLRDALFLTHPKPRTAAQKELFNKIAQETLSTPYTWETQMSKGGQEDTRSKKEIWEELILSGRMNYMALMRNLRNFLDTGISEIALKKVAGIISNPDQIRKSKQFPFRFLTAYRSIGGGIPERSFWHTTNQTVASHSNPLTPMLLNALEKAVLVSIENIPMLMNQNLLIAADVSGSMQGNVSEKSVVQYYDIGVLLGMLVKQSSPDSVFGIFGDDWKDLNDLPTNKVLSATNEVHNREGEVGYSTHGYKVIEYAIHQKKVFDRVFVFTDGQMYGHGSDLRNIDQSWKKYKNTIAPKSKLYMFNLCPYGETPLDLRGGDVNIISGWSEKIFGILSSIEDGGQVLDEIKEIKL